MLDMFFSLRCPDCGKKISEDDSVCQHCGAHLDVPLDDIERSKTAKQYLEDAQNTYDSGVNIQSALANVNIALDFEPEAARAHNLKGLILDAIGRTNDAIKSYQEAIRLDPYFDEAKSNLADAEAENYNKVGTTEVISNQQEGLISKNIIGITRIFIVLGGVAALGLIYIFGRDYFGPKTDIIFEPDYAQISTIDSAVLETTAEILTTRAHNLGYSTVSFIVTEAGQIIGKVPSYIDAKKLVERISPIGLLEFVDFGLTPVVEDTVITTDFENIYIQQTGEKQWHTIMTNSGINEATTTKGPTGNFEISFSLTDEGKKVFADHTSTNVGNYLGIVLDKVVMSAPVINQPITEGQAMISGNFTEEEAQDLATIIRTTPLPIPIKFVEDADSDK
jgi:zinc-ribbon domain/Tetratricopeptide repeat